ncbi:hypothetical protein BO71DRAFT_407236 [Aspergillus ellipticus CBS 707.79]|uniref:Apple domain-containing protein n=1 Tax=Aspergillus ellipticus CBS 707.79 TaxID=1448320 RepID=A0A319DSI3_9EURO|nr:hypothetical protein BO71DRAFT_407236 [Aspergillus ellipticus CBS 707.79]
MEFFLSPAWLVLFLLFWSERGLSETSVDTAVESNSGFVGWYVGPAGIQAITETAKWSTSGNYAAACTGTTTCTFATQCTGTTIFWNNNESGSCYLKQCDHSPDYLFTDSNIVGR